MRIALDGTPLSVSTGGVRRYTEELSRALAGEFPEDEYHLISDQAFRFTGERPRNLHVQNRRPPNALDRRWWLFGANHEMSRLRVDLFHGTDFSVPYLVQRPSVMTLHDLSPWMGEGWHHGADRVRQRTPLLIRMRRATMMITPTEAVRGQAMSRFKIEPDRIVAVPEAACDWLHPAPVTDPGGEPYFVYVGTLEPRKNIPMLIEAWRHVRQRHSVSLVLAGRRRQDFPALAEEPGLRFLGEFEDSDLPALYSGAIAAVYPSLYEGFGLPVLEAMSCGAAVVTSRDPAIMEVSEGAAIHVDAADGTAWAGALEVLLEQPEELNRRREQSLKRAVDFSWQRTARLTREVYVEAIRRFAR
jgi:glycosyltransferase involved in cell wall biosynthesis